MKTPFNLEKLLTDDFGLSANETALYLALLKNGPSTVLIASELTGINRATVHMNLDYLQKKGLINQVKKGRGARRTITAEPPEKLAEIVRSKKAKLESIEEKLPRAIIELNNLQATLKKDNDLDIRHYKGKNEVRFLYEFALQAKELRAYRNYKKLSILFPMNAVKLIEIHSMQKEKKVWEIIEDAKETHAYLDLMPKERFYARLAPKNANLCNPNIDYMIFDGHIAIVDFSKEINGVIIRNEIMYKNAVAIFNFIWDILKPATPQS